MRAHGVKRLCRLVVPGLFLVACCGGDDVEPTDGAVQVDGAGLRRLGEVRVLSGGLVGQEGNGTVRAKFRRAGILDYRTTIAADGLCIVRSFERGSCEACEGLCVAPDTCVPDPGPFDSVGSLSMSGLLADPALLRASDGSYEESVYLAEELFNDGDVVTATGTGDDFPRFEIGGIGVARLMPAFGFVVDASRLEDLVLSWTPGGSNGRIRLEFEAEAPCVWPGSTLLVCDSADVGRLVVSSSLLSLLGPNAGEECAPSMCCPYATLMRYDASSVMLLDGFVELIVGSVAAFRLQLD